MAKLVFKECRDKIKEYEILGDIVTIGRGRFNAITLSDDKLSREHCVVERQGKKFIIRDLKSLNGTFVNDKMITAEGVKLSSGDMVRIGDTVFIFQKEHGETSMGLTRVVESTEKELKKGKGYNTMLAEIVRDVKRHDLKVVEKEGKEKKAKRGFFQNAISKLGWGPDTNRLAKEAAGKKVETFDRHDIIKVDSPKPDERVIRLRKRLPRIDSGSIVIYGAIDYLVLSVRDLESGITEYRIKEC